MHKSVSSAVSTPKLLKHSQFNDDMSQIVFGMAMQLIMYMCGHLEYVEVHVALDQLVGVIVSTIHVCHQ